jgi:biopolymer transport protein ExbD
VKSIIQMGIFAIMVAAAAVVGSGCDQAGTSVAKEAEVTVKVSVNKAGQITVDGQQSTAEQLKSKLAGLGQTTTQIIFWAEDPANAQAQAALKVINESGIGRLTMSEAPF